MTKSNTASVNGAPCMPVQGNSDAGFPSGLKKYPHLRFMPRLGFAYRPFGNDKWAIRGGFSIYNINMLGSSFYSLTGTVQAYTQQFSNSYNSSTHAIGYQWPQISQGAGGDGCTNCYGTDCLGTANSTNWKDPYTEQWALSVDHDFGKGYAGRVSYIGSATRQLVWAPDENTLPFSSTVSAFNAPITARMFPNWGRINTRATGANERYDSLQVEGDHQLQNGIEFHSTFTWAKNLADNQGPASTSFGGEGGGQRATSILDRHVDFGNAYGTRRLRWNTTALYDLPFGRGKMFGSNLNRAADLVLGGWRMSSILTLQTGPYLTPTSPPARAILPAPAPASMARSVTALEASTAATATSTPINSPASAPVPRGQNRFGWTNAAAFACPGDSTWTAGHPCKTGAGFTSDASGNMVPNGPHPLPIGRFGNSQVGTIEGPGLFNLSAVSAKRSRSLSACI